MGFIQEPFRLFHLDTALCSAPCSGGPPSLLGLGAQPPTPSWGGMLSKAREQLFTAPWISIFPGLAIFVTVLGLNLLGDGLRDVLDPRTTRQRR